MTPMCHVGVVTWCLSANHSSPHSGPILSHMHALELQLCMNVLSSCFVHEMHEMSNHNKFQEKKRREAHGQQKGGGWD